VRMLGLVESHGGMKAVGLLIFWVVEIVRALTVFSDEAAADAASMAADAGAQCEWIR
jgi:hypothetical protein